MSWFSYLVIALAMMWAIWEAGERTGIAKATATCAHNNVAAYQELLDQSATHLKEANASSVQLFQQLRLRHDAERATTEELRHVLAETADSRAGCRFPDSVMQQLESTRARAAEATTSGLGAAVPAAGGSE